MSSKPTVPDSAGPGPTAPSTLHRWFPIGEWLPRYEWGAFLSADLIAAVSVAALLIPESMRYASVAGVPFQIFAIQQFIPKLPAALTAVIVAAVLVAVFDPDIDLVAEIPEGLPSFGLPTGIDASTWGTLLLGGASWPW